VSPKGITLGVPVELQCVKKETLLTLGFNISSRWPFFDDFSVVGLIEDFSPADSPLV
jgi:hypothetical protein